ncbi:MAG: selenite/tellurite reduction operon porin ExtI, partial [Desulfuromusa sp.]|nr:selenite/tellurite reduction operon porin ExtI [Desulfuromusa sp.]
YRVDAMNGNDSEVDSNLRYSARVHVSLLDPEKGYGYKGTYMGQKKVLTFGAAYQMESDVAYANSNLEQDAVDYSAWTVDGFFEYPIEGMGAVTLSAAYVDYDLDDAYQGASPSAGVTGVTGEKNGGYVKAGYMLPNMPLQFFGRSESWSFANLYGVTDHEVELLGLGLNYYVRGQNLKVTVEYTNCDYDSNATVEDSDTVVAQVQVIF